MSTPFAIDDVDLRHAAAELDRGRVELAAAYKLAGTHERREAIKAALAKLAWVARTIDELVDRRTP